MMCHQCREQIEVGEACRTERLPFGLRYFHPTCYMRFMDDDKAIEEAFDEIAKRQGDLFKKP